MPLKALQKMIVILDIQQKELFINRLKGIRCLSYVDLFCKIPIKGAIENEVKQRPMLANPIADATSLNDSVYTNGPFPGIPLAHIP